MEKYKMLALGSGLLSKETRDLIDNDCDEIPLAIFTKQWPASTMAGREVFGWFIHVPEEEEEIEYANNIPEDLKKIVLYANGNGYEWIMFDYDIPIENEDNF